MSERIRWRKAEHHEGTPRTTSRTSFCGRFRIVGDVSEVAPAWDWQVRRYRVHVDGEQVFEARTWRDAVAFVDANEWPLPAEAAS